MAQKYRGYDKAGTKTNVMTPLNWFAGCAETILGGLVYGRYDTWVGPWAMVLMFLMVNAYVCIYLYFMTKDPDRLQSESYQLAAQEMTLSIQSDEPNPQLLGAPISIEPPVH